MEWMERIAELMKEELEKKWMEQIYINIRRWKTGFKAKEKAAQEQELKVMGTSAIANPQLPRHKLLLKIS